MNFLFPAMFIGMAGLAVPIAIHLIAKHKYPVWPFAATRLLRLEKRDNAFARRLVDPFQLLLRLIVLALLVLAMARLFSPALSDKPAPRNVIVVLDTSASMRMESKDPVSEGTIQPLAIARKVAGKLLEEVELPSRCALVLAGDEVNIVSPLGPDSKGAIEALEALEPSDGTGPGLVTAVAQSADMLHGRREVSSQIVVLTDRGLTAFATQNQQDLRRIKDLQEELGDKLDVIVVDVATGETENLAVVDAYLRGGEVRRGDDSHVVARVKNFGSTNQVMKLALNVAGKPEPDFRSIDLESGEEVVVDLTSKVRQAIRAFATVQLKSEDAVPHDNSFSVPFVVTASRRVLLVNGTSDSADGGAAASVLAEYDGADETAEEMMDEVIDGARILQYVLNPGRELGVGFGTGLDTTQITPDVFSAQTLSKYDVIILYDVSELANSALNDLDNFVKEGRSVLLFTSGAVNLIKFNSSLAASKGEREALAPAKLGEPLVLENPGKIDVENAVPMELGEGVTSDPGPWLMPFRDRRKGDMSAIRFTKIRATGGIEKGANVLMRSSEGQALAVEIKRGRGRVVQLCYGVELSKSNLATTRAFPLMTWRLMDYLCGRLRVVPPDTLVAGAPSSVDVSEGAFSMVTNCMMAPVLAQGIAGGDGKKNEALMLEVIDQKGAKTVYVDGLSAGHYFLQKVRRAGSIGMGYTRPIAVNADSAESDLSRMEEEGLKKVFGEDLRLIKPKEAKGLAVIGGEAWRLVVLLLMAAYVIEAVSAYLLGVAREKKMEALQAEDEALEQQ